MAILGRPDPSTVMPDFWAGKEDARTRGYNYLPTPFSPFFLFSTFFSFVSNVVLNTNQIQKLCFIFYAFLQDSSEVFSRVW